MKDTHKRALKEILIFCSSWFLAYFFLVKAQNAFPANLNNDAGTLKKLNTGLIYFSIGFSFLLFYPISVLFRFLKWASRKLKGKTVN